MEFLISIPHYGTCPREYWETKRPYSCMYAQGGQDRTNGMGQWLASEAGLISSPFLLPSKPLEERDGLVAQTHPVEDISPPFHGDALVHGEHREAEVVKVGDAMVGPWPASSALTTIDGAGAPRASSRTG